MHTLEEELFTYCDLQLNLSKNQDKDNKERKNRASRMASDIRKIINTHKKEIIR